MTLNPLAHLGQHLTRYLALSATAGAGALHAQPTAVDTLGASRDHGLTPNRGSAMAMLARPLGRHLTDVIKAAECVAEFENDNTVFAYVCAQPGSQPTASATGIRCDLTLGSCAPDSSRTAGNMGAVTDVLGNVAASQPNAAASALTAAAAPQLFNLAHQNGALMRLLTGADDDHIAKLFYADSVHLGDNVSAQDRSSTLAIIGRIGADALRWALYQTGVGARYAVNVDPKGTATPAVTLQPEAPRNNRFVSATVNGGTVDGLARPFATAAGMLAWTWNDASGGKTIDSLLHFDHDLGALRNVAGRTPDLAANFLLDQVLTVQAKYPGSQLAPSGVDAWTSAMVPRQDGFYAGRTAFAVACTLPRLGLDGARTADGFVAEVSAKMQAAGYSTADQDTVTAALRMTQRIGAALMNR